MQPHGPPSRMLEKSCVRVKWGAVLTGAAKSSFHWMTIDYRDWGHMPIKHDLSTCLLALV